MAGAEEATATIDAKRFFKARRSGQTGVDAKSQRGGRKEQKEWEKQANVWTRRGH